MKYLLAAVSLLFLALPAFAHLEADSVGFWPYFTAKQEFAVHAQGGSASEITAMLKPDADISIKDYGPAEKISGAFGNWYRIAYAQGNESGEGFIWSPEGLVNESLLYGETRFVYETATDKETHTAQVVLKAFDKNGRLIAQSPVMQVVAEVANNVRFAALNGDGLENVEFIAQIYMSAEACGYPVYTYYFAWANNKLVPLPYAVALGGEGIYTSYAENVVFPAGGAPWNTIVKVVAAYEPLDEDDYRTKNDFATEIYRWDGTKAVLIQQDARILYWNAAGENE